jgi:pyrroline-5-carboxylate reductase
MTSKKIAILGAGNLGSAILEGLLKSGYVPLENITVTDKHIPAIQQKFGTSINAHSNNPKAVKESDIVIIAVKPKHIKALLEEVTDVLDPKKHIIVSMAAGVSLKVIQDIIKKPVPLFRGIPNTAISVAQSMTCISTHEVSNEIVDTVIELFKQLGEVAVIEEDLMAAATVLGSCGTAFALRYIRAAAQGGIEMGLNAKLAQLISSQTVKGAAALILEKDTHPESEIDKVTTPQGITITGLNEMEHEGFSSSLIKGMLVAFKKMS